MGQNNPKAASPARKLLNIVYFIDSAKTRSTSLSMTKVYVVVLVILVMSLWSLGSIYLLIYLTRNSLRTEQELRSTRRLLFEYQVQYDRVFENAYPLNENLAEKFKKNQEAATEGSTQHSEPSKNAQQNLMPQGLLALVHRESNSDTAKNLKEEEKNRPSTNDKTQDAGKGQPNLKPKTHLELLDLQNQVIIKQGNLISLSLDMVNRNQDEKVEGYLWVMAEYTYKSGEKAVISAPSGMAIDSEKNIPKNLKEASAFAIRRIKRRTFQFRLPKDEPGELTKLTLGITDRQGSAYRTVPLTINLENHSPGPLTL